MLISNFKNYYQLESGRRLDTQPTFWSCQGFQLWHTVCAPNQLGGCWGDPLRSASPWSRVRPVWRGLTCPKRSWHIPRNDQLAPPSRGPLGGWACSSICLPGRPAINSLNICQKVTVHIYLFVLITFSIAFRFSRSLAVQFVTKSAVGIPSWFLTFLHLPANLSLDEVFEVLVVLNLAKIGQSILYIGIHWVCIGYT